MKKIAILVFTTVLLVGLGVPVLAFFYESKPAIYVVPDVSGVWHHRHTDWESKWCPLKGAQLTVRLRGYLDGTAEVSGGRSQVIGPGFVSLEYTEPEWWCEYCELSYRPGSVRQGNLSIEVDIK